MEGLWGLQGVMREKHNRDLTNLDLMGRGDEEGGVGGRMFAICSTILGSGVV